MLPVTIRLALDTDRPALERLAERDTRPLPAGTLLLAERDGSVGAVLSLDTGEAIADPFKPTAELVDLLRSHARADSAPMRPPRHRRLAPRLVGRPA